MIRRRQLALGFALLVAVGVVAASSLFVEQTPNIPNIFNPSETRFQNQTHFLTFTGSDTPAESSLTSTAYYNAVDPYHQKGDFPHWLLNAGFISDVSQWNPTGPQLIACDLGTAAGCDMPAHNPDGSLVYGPNIINTDSHAIVLNAADLGFVRNQFIRCKPSCSALNPIIYTYLENYPVNPFAASGAGRSGFPMKTGYPTTTEGQLAIQSALNRPNVHSLPGCVETTTDTPFGCKISRIADVAFEWAPPPTNPSSSTRYGQQYAYLFDDTTTPGTITETLAFLAGGDQNCNDANSQCTPYLTSRTLQPFDGVHSTGAGVFTIALTAKGSGYISAPAVSINGGGGTGATAVATINKTLGTVSGVTLTNAGVGYTSTPTVLFSGGGGNGANANVTIGNTYTGSNADPFPPNLDFIGFKNHPGVCYICHGGKPAKLTASGAYPNQGNVSGFRFLPIDIRNMLFTSDAGLGSPPLGDQPATNGSLTYTDRLHEELQIKEYNIVVLKTVPTTKENDGTGATRVAHLREAIIGWYAGYAGDQTMSSNIQNGFWQSTYHQDFVPSGWLEPVHGGTAPPGSEHLYLTVVSPSCRSCHFNREVSLDFGTTQNFKQDSDLLQLALIEQCKASNPDRGAKAMPLAHLTYQRYWQANPSTGGTAQVLPYPAPGLVITNTADQIAAYFGYGSVAGYCATNP